MINRHRFHLAAACALLLASVRSGYAQQDVMRDSYGFFGSTLDVEVATDAPGRIRLIRGQRARIEVAGRAPDGFTSAALGGHGVRRLTLTALASGPVDFVVAVPEDVRVRVRWEGSNRSELFGTLTRNATFAWDTNAPRPAIETRGGRPNRSTPEAFALTPRIIDIVAAHRYERITVRIGEPAFALRPAGNVETELRGARLRITGGAARDLSVDVPADASVVVRLDGVDAIVIEDVGVQLLCESILSQSLPDGRRWLTLTPAPTGGCAVSEPAAPARPDATVVRRT